MAEQTREQVLTWVKEAVCEANLLYTPEDITEDLHLVDDLALDWLDCVEFVMGVEEKFGIEVSDDDAERWRTVGEWTDYIFKAIGG